jgi:isocitrate lyase
MSRDNEQAQFEQEVAELKQWWTDSRWRFTRRAYTAEQIVSKRGTIKIEYPSNQQSKKLWKLVEGRFKVSLHKEYKIRSRSRLKYDNLAASTFD